MKDKKGFTLIELLAIIVILAIIAVITVPIILNIIDDAQSGAAVDSAYGFKDAIEKYYVQEMAKNSNFDLAYGSYTINSNGTLSQNGETYNINMSGVKPTGGTIAYQDGKIKNACLTINGYKVEYVDSAFTNTGKGNCGEVAESESCINVTYDVNMEACREYFLGVGASEEEATNVCNGTETYEGYTRDYILTGSTGKSFMQYGIDLAVERGLISNVRYEKTCESCFIYADGPKEIESFNLNCPAYLEINDITDPTTVDDFCNNGGEIEGITYSDIVQELKSVTMREGFDELVSMGLISDVTYGESKAISQFLCYEDNPYGMPEYTSLSDFNIPNIVDGKSVVAINPHAFSNLGLTGSLNLQDNTNLEKIDYNAFGGNQLTSVTIPSSVISMGHRVFNNNPNLTINVIGYTEKPSGWDVNWNNDGNWNFYPVNWNYGG